MGAATSPPVAYVFGVEDARLIAAAPDLLEALKEALSFIDEVEGHGYGGMSVHMCAQMAARDAIAKAEGQ